MVSGFRQERLKKQNKNKNKNKNKKKKTFFVNKLQISCSLDGSRENFSQVYPHMS